MNNKISTYKIIHMMHNDKFSAPLVHFFNKYFDNKKHIFVFHGHFHPEFPMAKYENVLDLDSLKDIKIDIHKVDKIILHGLFTFDSIYWLYENKELLSKAYWVIWGNDLYREQTDEKELYVKSNLKGYISSPDQEFAKEKYNFRGELIDVKYVFPIDIEMIKNTKENNLENTKNKSINIQINNSCDKSTIEVLQELSKFKDKNIKVRTILSYGQMQYKDEIIKIGTDLFREKFEPVMQFKKPKEYTQHLAQNDILILNQNRQQGFGNIVTSFILGVKILIRNEITTYKYFNNHNINVYDAHKIKNISYEEFIKYEEHMKEKNSRIVTDLFFDIDSLVNDWRTFFNKTTRTNL